MFVDKNRRSSIDDKISLKLDVMSKKSKNTISLSEAQIVYRWYCSIPTKIVDNLDCKVYKNIEEFIILNG